MDKYISKDNLITYDTLIKDYIKNKAQNLLEIFAYGVLFNINVGDPHLTRIGNMSLHKSLPIQSLLKGCIAQGGKVMYWLNPDDWRFRKDTTGFILKDLEVVGAGGDSALNITNDVFSTLLYDLQYVRIDGNVLKIKQINIETKTATVEFSDKISGTTFDVELGAVLNGYDGTVRVYCPEFYIKSESEGDYRRVWLSTIKIDDTWTKLESLLLDAYRSTLLNTVPSGMGYLSTLPTNSVISVVNTNTYCRGGGNRSAYDKYLNSDNNRTDLGKPRTYISRANMRNYSKNTNSRLLSYDDYKNIFYWLYVIEYANFNSQEAFNSSLTSDGYHQGGMGASVTTMGNWNEYNSYYPVTPCGYGNILGNNTGLVTLTIPEFTYGTDNTVRKEQTMKMARWRGFDNPFGDINTNLDGIIIDADSDNHPNNMNYVYTCQDSSKFADSLNDSYVKIGEEIHLDGYIKSFDLGDAAHIIPHVIGCNTTQYICDYHYSGSKNNTLRTLFVGGGAHYGGGAGVGRFFSDGGVSYSWSHDGFRSVSGVASF